MTAQADLLAYVRMVAAHSTPWEFLELRYRQTHDRNQFGRSFERVDRVEAVATRILMLGRTTDVYLACAPRARRGGTLRDVAGAAVAWVDLDSDAAVDALAEFAPAPSVVIGSGSGRNQHAYWALAERVGAEEVASANRKLAHALGGDQGSPTSAAAILRPPATRNHKRQPPTLVEAQLLKPDHRVSIDTLTAGLPDPAEHLAERSAPRHRPGGPDPLLDIAPDVYVTRLLGVEVPRSRKVTCPFHEDRTPSLHVYETPKRGWCCFSSHCSLNGRQRGGSIYNLAGALWGLECSGADFLSLRSELQRVFMLVPA